MSEISSFPLRHLSIRVPWHDNGWDGSICNCPKRNTACLKLANIADCKDETLEEEIAGKFLHEVSPDEFPACVTERGTFMAGFPFDRLHVHPYHRTSPNTHGHFKPTSLHYPAYAAAALPFRWMMKPEVFGDSKKGIRGLVEDHLLESCDPSHEPELRFDSHWIQDHRNHRALLDCFWKHIQVEESLAFFYAKQVPLVEDAGRRVLIGVGRVLNIGVPTEYEYTEMSEGKIRSLLWECMITHSIRPGFREGFLLPYHELLEKSDNGLNFDPSEAVAFAPDGSFAEFSYATEHVRSDTAISSLLSCRNALLQAGQLVNIETRTQEQWIDRQVGRLWKIRGPFPGMGAVLTATGIPMGHFIAQTIVEKAGETANPWDIWKSVVNKPKDVLPSDLARHVDSTICRAWHLMKPERLQFLQLLSRIDMTYEQADIIAVPEERHDNGIPLNDNDFIQNPYLIYESTRLCSVPISIGAVDRGLFPTTFIRSKFPLSEPSMVKTSVDKRRLRALVVRELEEASQKGNTLSEQSKIISSLRQSDKNSDETNTLVTADLLAVAEEQHFAGEIRVINMADGSPAYQLERLGKVGDLIRNTATKRAQAQRHTLSVDWRAELDQLLDSSLPDDPEERTKEENARQEKAQALAEIAASRFSVLIGPAGTGKTTLLSVLCRRSEIYDGGILLLAPTGKARVRMEDVARRAGTQNYQACTLAQHLSRSGRYDANTQRYRLIAGPGEMVARTVIIDECSMLTEEMIAALLESLKGMHRLIFVGDYRQLPPIGAGRPFADIVSFLQPDDIETRFPRVATSYAELTIPRRQGAGDRDDLQLAAWFGGGSTGPGEDQVFEILAGARDSETIAFIPWETPDELDDLLPKVLSETLDFDSDLDEWKAFSCSLGGNLCDRGNVWFNSSWGDKVGSGICAEAWQLLSPVRQKPWGVESLNRLIHRHYKATQIDKARNPGKYRSIPKPMGDQQIIYGDKVINNRNWAVSNWRLHPKPDGRGYLANGEIGMVVGHRRTKKRKWLPKNIEIEFSTQPGTVFTFYPGDFSDDGPANLELAYALTVHKAQGSEFDVVFLVLPRSPLMLTKELLYTSLTRQKRKIVILHQGSAIDLQKLSSERYSSIAVRLTNLFNPPKPVAIGDTFLEENLIHLTSRGEAVRSKSEVIIANLLHAKGIDYSYESPLELDGIVKYPDFTIEDDNTGIAYYWEHCGLLYDPAYNHRWQQKQKWYSEHGILPQEQGGGPNGTLVTTQDDKAGGIDSHEITERIEKIFNV